MPTTNATAMMTYFQSGYRFMARGGVRADGAHRRPTYGCAHARGTRPRAGRSLSTPSSQRLDRALGQQLGDGAALDRHFGLVGNFDRDVLVADLGNPSEDAARGDDFVALLERLQH